MCIDTVNRGRLLSVAMYAVATRTSRSKLRQQGNVHGLFSRQNIPFEQVLHSLQHRNNYAVVTHMVLSQG